jgi:hypothetical protein
MQRLHTPSVEQDNSHKGKAECKAIKLWQIQRTGLKILPLRLPYVSQNNDIHINSKT